ncbi:MAG: GNAT family N-acetyltransferase [Nocardioidaceae bacterium]|nr:GNAT family N-acetyltransferase [Nocardioidaceae bacterium]
MSYPDDVPILTDGVVTLRAHRPDDVDAVVEQSVDPVSVQWTTVPTPYHRSDGEEFVGLVIPQGWDDGDRWAFAVEARDDDGSPRYCGTVELHDMGSERGEIAYGSHPWARGRGLMHRALDLLLAWGFDDLGLRAVIWWANRGNWASRRTAWRLGFTCDGTVERWLPQRGALLDGWVGVLHHDDERAPRGTWYDVPRIVGERVVLRAHRPEDAVRVQEACNDERTRYWFHALPDPYPIEEAEKYLLTRMEQRANGTGITWAVADPETDVLLANISIFDVKPGREAEIGYWTHPAARGRGLMTEACGLVVRHAFVPEIGRAHVLQRLIIFAAEQNTASRHVIESNGFVRIGTERKGIRVRDGSLLNTACYDMLVEDYAASAG